MRHVFKIFTAIFIFIYPFLFLKGQIISTPHQLPSNLPLGNYKVDNTQVDSLKNRFHSANQRIGQQIVLDYDAVDEIQATNSGGSYQRYIWDLNSNYDENDPNRFALTWAVTRFDTLYDANSQAAFPYNSAINIDSIDIYITHQNTTGTPDYIEVSIYKWQGTLGIQVDAQEEIINQIWYDTLIVTTSSLTPAANQLGVLTIRPNVSLPAGERFSVGVHFYGDTATSTFTVLAGYSDLCNGSCFAYPSVFDLNSIYRIIAWSGSTNLTGINALAYDCNGNSTLGEAVACEEFSIQNFAITAYVSQQSGGTQIGDIESTLGNYWFVQGISPVYNDFYLINEPSNIDHIVFYLLDQNSNSLGSVGTDTDGNDGWSISGVDMGNLPIGTFAIYAEYYNAVGTYIAGSNPLVLGITEKPRWLDYGTIDVVQVDDANQVISAHGTLNLSMLALDKSISSIIGLSGQVFGLTDPKLEFDVDYSWPNYYSQVSNQQLNIGFKAFSSSAQQITNTSPFSTQIGLDADFNLIFNGSVIWEPDPIRRDFKFKNVPLVGLGSSSIFSIGAACVSAELNFTLQPKIKAQVVVGANQGNWSFTQNGSNTTQLLGKLTTVATAKGELNTICASAFGFSGGIGTLARGKVTAELVLGGGYTYSDASGPDDKWAGKFTLYAEGEVAGLNKKAGQYGPKLWGGSDSSALAFKIDEVTDSFFNFQSSTFKTDPNVTPESWPMQAMDAIDSLLAIVWMDDINNGNNTALLISYYLPTQDAFTEPFEIAVNDSGILQPSVSLLPSGNAIVTWSQLNYQLSQIDTNSSSVDEVLKGQDIWLAIYDPYNNQLVYKNKLLDNSGALAEGEPKITWGPGNNGLITWQIGDEVNQGSDIYYSVLTEDNTGYTITQPQVLTASLTGANFNLQVSYVNSNEIIAEWINDPDVDNSTINNTIKYAEFNGVAWTSPEERFLIEPGIDVKSLSMSANGIYGAEAVTYDYFSWDSTLVSGIFLGWWNDGDPNGASYSNLSQPVEDSIFYYQLPKVAVSESGISTLTLQIIDKYELDDNGQLNLFIKDLNSATTDWENIYYVAPEYLDFVTDTNQFVWDMATSFGYIGSQNSSDIMYLLTQEMDNSGNTNPTYGDVFGNPNMNLVLRTFKVTSNNGIISLSNVEVPSDSLVLGYYEQKNTLAYDFDLKQNFPNPFSSSTTIPFHLSKKGHVTLKLIDSMGKEVGRLIDREFEPGDYYTQFNRGNLKSGLYLLYMTVNGNRMVKRIVIN